MRWSEEDHPLEPRQSWSRVAGYLEGSGESQEIPTISHIAVGSGQGKG
jgi:hypothetical protein